MTNNLSVTQGDTISAVATSLKEAGIGIVRISGEGAIKVASSIFKPANGKPVESIESHYAVFGYVLNNKEPRQILDEAILIIMRSPRSYTREDVVEIQCHGGKVVLREILALTYEAGARPAERGEFTKRAFLNGRLDLLEARAVMEVISAKTEKTLAMASGHLRGNLSGRICEIRRELLAMIAQIEAAIDFPEDGVEEIMGSELAEKIAFTQKKIEDLLGTYRSGKILREGLMTAIIGRPNVGKSSLLNALLREERAIVTDIPGTTRDSIEEYADIGGVPLRIIDTAGIRETGDKAEYMGVERARRYAREASLLLMVFDGSEFPTKEDEEIISLAKDKEVIFIINKSDLPQNFPDEILTKAYPSATLCKISLKEGRGLLELERGIVSKACGDDVAMDEGSFIDDERTANLLKKSREHLLEARSALLGEMGMDFVSIDLRSAWERLGEITGEVVTEDIISEIFSKFCIGK